ncbi:aminopeptidase [Oceanobacillus bengalensis]|uniref:Aminopeptidase n=1 Tax=Oceanobacillus bengalensis TaxID=1435466 RepID=A0A494Z0M0_9BACI|nr:aminopeptidase [Oceanobacillus bengalensis]RKQ15514.1 aminopeptidase [Oceanobacillus bengalensis]
MKNFQENLEKYASLAIEVGVNIQKGQTLYINAPISAVEFVRILQKKAYERGAFDVEVNWSDDDLTRTKFEMAPNEVFNYFPKYKVKHLEELAENNAAFLSVLSSDPDLLNGIDPERIQTASITRSTALKTFANYQMSDKVSWSIVSTPNKVWAKKIYPELEEDEAVESLWNAIFSATRANLAEPVQAWQEHIETLDTKASHLNQQKYKALHYVAEGTDLTIELPEKHVWISAGSVNAQGTVFVANIPTEEVFTAPLRTGVNGTVTATKPLSYSGNLIENFSITFKDGKIVDYQAEKGYETLKNLIETDEGSHYLGEVALVPHRSPISDTDLIFYETLFDENASNHIAIGKGYAFCIEGGKTMSEEVLKENGLNDSLTHVDFMIGSEKMDIDGILADGTKEPVFRNGNWAF